MAKKITLLIIMIFVLSFFYGVIEYLESSMAMYQMNNPSGFMQLLTYAKNTAPFVYVIGAIAILIS